jgi:N6-L-threonylcarbamoyladenine synthase
MYTLGIETSCDETSAAILYDNRILASEIYSQEIHAVFGGVVPEIASRAHISKIDVLCKSVFSKYDIKPEEINLVAVTDRPGLAGALLVGISFAMGLNASFKIPITGINHLEGHICSVFLEHPDIKFPLITLIASGGHTSIYKMDNFGEYEQLGRTVDDAAGEAFDKIGKLVGFSYPAGRAIENAARTYGNGKLIQFPVAKTGRALDFSFSGLKTSVKYFLKDKGQEYIEENRSLVCASIQKAIVDSLVKNTLVASQTTGIKNVAVSGGVACNSYLRERMAETFGQNVFFPSPRLSTDNAAMIALAGYERGKRSMLRFPSMSPSASL